MAGVHSTEGGKLQPYELSDELLVAMAKIIRGCAEIEDLVTLFICDLAGINEEKAKLLLGRTTLAARVNLAEVFAKGHSEGAAALHKHIFRSDMFETLLDARNTIAHGVYLGRMEPGYLAFQTGGYAIQDNEFLMHTVRGFPEEVFFELAKIATGIIPAIETDLKLGQRREARRKLPVGIHPKAQVQKKREAKPKRPPRSSRKSKG